MAVLALRDQFAAVRKNTQAQLGARILMIAEAANAAIMALPPQPHGYVRTIFPNNLIVYEYQRSDLVIEFALDVLRSLSPRLSGAYQEAHTVYVNGVAVQAPYQFSSTDSVMIANPEPYAREIEVGHMKMRVPGTDHVYQQAQRVVNRAYGDQVLVEFNYVALPSASLAGKFRRGVQPQSRRRLQKDTRQGASPMFPALIFTARGTQAVPPSTPLLYGATDIKLLT